MMGPSASLNTSLQDLLEFRGSTGVSRPKKGTSFLKKNQAYINYKHKVFIHINIYIYTYMGLINL